MSNATQIKFTKVSALPSTMTPNTVYMVTDATDANLFQMYVSSSDGSSARHINTKAEIQTMINAAVAASTSIIVVPNITARDALNLSVVRQVMVIDATGDSSVTSGTATYVFDPTAAVGSQWTKISEAESMDVVLQWANIVGKPTSAVADIDDAVTRRHSHANKTDLDRITVSSNGDILIDGNLTHTLLESAGW